MTNVTDQFVLINMKGDKIFDFFDKEGIEILSMRNETNRLEELFLKLTNNDN